MNAVKIIKHATGLSKSKSKRLLSDLTRFLRVCSLSTEKLTPSISIDLAWHALLAVPECYQKLTDKLGCRINHVPCEDMLANRERFIAAKNLVKERYGRLSANWKLASTCADCYGD